MKNKKIIIIVFFIVLVVLLIALYNFNKTKLKNSATGTSTGGRVYAGGSNNHNYYARIKTKSLGHPDGEYYFVVWPDIEENKNSDGSQWCNYLTIGFFPHDVTETQKTNLKEIKINGKQFKYYIEGDTARLIYNTKKYDYDFCIDIILNERVLYDKSGDIIEEAECIMTDELLKSKIILDEIQFEIEEE